jgi:hypothetical protein
MAAEVVSTLIAGRPLIISYWELLYRSNGWARRQFEHISSAEHDAGDIRVESYGTQTLHFVDGECFSCGYKELRGREICIRLNVAGRKPILRVTYP